MAGSVEDREADPIDLIADLERAFAEVQGEELSEQIFLGLIESAMSHISSMRREILTKDRLISGLKRRMSGHDRLVDMMELLSPDQIRVCYSWSKCDDIYSVLSFGDISKASGLDRARVREAVRGLAKMGLASYCPYSMTECGEFYGAGYSPNEKLFPLIRLVGPIFRDQEDLVPQSA